MVEKRKLSSKSFEPYQLGKPEEPYKPAYEPEAESSPGDGMPAGSIIVFAVACLLALGLVAAVGLGYYFMSSAETAPVTVNVAGVSGAETGSGEPTSTASAGGGDDSADLPSTTLESTTSTVKATSTTYRAASTTMSQAIPGLSCGSIKDANGASDCAKGTCQTPGMACRYVPGSIYTQGSCGCRRV